MVGAIRSYLMEESYLLVAARYFAMNPVAAGLVDQPADYRGSIAHVPLGEEEGGLTPASPLLEMVGNWSNFLLLPSTEELTLPQRHEQSGRPLGFRGFYGESGV